MTTKRTDRNIDAASLDLDKLRTVIEQHEQAARDAEMAASAFRTLADDNQREAYRSRDVITTTVNAAILRWPDLSEQIEALEQSVLKAGEQR